MTVFLFIMNLKKFRLVDPVAPIFIPHVLYPITPKFVFGQTVIYKYHINNFLQKQEFYISERNDKKMFFILFQREFSTDPKRYKGGYVL